MGFVEEFLSFLNKHKIVGLAVAFIVATAATKLVSALVADIIMPLVGVLTPSGNWRLATVDVGPIKFMVGDFAGALIDFAIIALVAFMLIKYVAKEDAKQ